MIRLKPLCNRSFFDDPKLHGVSVHRYDNCSHFPIGALHRHDDLLRRNEKREAWRHNCLHLHALLEEPSEIQVSTIASTSFSAKIDRIKDLSSSQHCKILKKAFECVDISGHGTVPMQSMVSIFIQEGLKLGEQEMLDIMHRYDRRTQFDYVRFLRHLARLIPAAPNSPPPMAWTPDPAAQATSRERLRRLHQHSCGGDDGSGRSPPPPTTWSRSVVSSPYPTAATTTAPGSAATRTTSRTSWRTSTTSPLPPPLRRPAARESSSPNAAGHYDDAAASRRQQTDGPPLRPSALGVRWQESPARAGYCGGVCFRGKAPAAGGYRLEDGVGGGGGGGGEGGSGGVVGGCDGALQSVRAKVLRMWAGKAGLRCLLPGYCHYCNPQPPAWMQQYIGANQGISERRLEWM